MLQYTWNENMQWLDGSSVAMVDAMAGATVDAMVEKQFGSKVLKWYDTLI